MDSVVYRESVPGSVEAACRAAVERARRAHPDLDVPSALGGCRYEEWLLDN